jgi:hypothetical protein
MHASGRGVYVTGVMNQEPSTHSYTSSVSNADSVSRRAYELWENEGRPEGSDLRHWLQAEQELAGMHTTGDSANERTSPRNTGADTRPLQGTRAAAATSREPRRGSNSPFGEKNSSSQTAARRRPPNAPVL